MEVKGKRIKDLLESSDLEVRGNRPITMRNTLGNLVAWAVVTVGNSIRQGLDTIKIESKDWSLATTAKAVVISAFVGMALGQGVVDKYYSDHPEHVKSQMQFKAERPDADLMSSVYFKDAGMKEMSFLDQGTAYSKDEYSWACNQFDNAVKSGDVHAVKAINIRASVGLGAENGSRYLLEGLEQIAEHMRRRDDLSGDIRDALAQNSFESRLIEIPDMGNAIDEYVDRLARSGELSQRSSGVKPG